MTLPSRRLGQSAGDCSRINPTRTILWRGFVRGNLRRRHEGIVAKLAAGRYEPAATTWVKIKNQAYSQAEGRADFFAVTSTRVYPRPEPAQSGAYTVKKLLEP
jgi:hypothetical protein